MAALRGADPDAERAGERSVSELYALHPEAQEYYSFAFVRHPFSRALSLYHDMLVSPEVYTEEQRLHRGKGIRYLFDSFYGLAEVSSFEDFCRWLNTPYGSDAFADRHFLSQHAQVTLGGVSAGPTSSAVSRTSTRIGSDSPRIWGLPVGAIVTDEHDGGMGGNAGRAESRQIGRHGGAPDRAEQGVAPNPLRGGLPALRLFAGLRRSEPIRESSTISAGGGGHRRIPISGRRSRFRGSLQSDGMRDGVAVGLGE